MQWHLNIQLSKFPFEIQHRQKIFTIGSCFAENLSEYLKARHFSIFSNPNGILFNPSSIYITLKNILDSPNFFDERYLFKTNDDVWKSFLHQTNFFEDNKEKLLEKIIHIQLIAQEFLQASDFLFITFGSAYVYEHIELNTVVANCHKLPQKNFNKYLLSVQQIVEYYTQLFSEIKKFNPRIKIILSVSPVKYLVYGAVNNNVSKATLILAIHELCQKYSDVFYFPAYELITDDLRDYRFYKEDLAHPNDTAIQYVMSKFSESLFSDETKKIVQQIEKIISAMNHRPLNPYSKAYRYFAEKMLDECRMLEIRYPHIKLSKEREYFVRYSIPRI